MFKKLLSIGALTLVTGVAVLSQNAPGDVADLVGVRASSGESELRNRGYRFVKTEKSSGRSYSNWWRSNTNTCLSVVTYDGRYDSILAVTPADCNQSSGGNNGGSWGGNWGGNSNGGQVSPPSWARGTFYGTGPGGEQITLTINNNGSVTANVSGGMNYGTFTRGNYLNLGGFTSSVTRNGNGITTTSTNNGERINYSRNSWNTGNNNNSNNSGGWNGGWNGGNEGSRPPSWARGTFYGTAPNGTQIQLTINDGGSVTATIGGSPNYGTYSNGTLIINGQASRLERSGDGFVTVSNGNGERIYYSRNTWGGGGNSGGSNEPMPNLIDLIGVRSAQGDAEARNRGFRIVDTSRDGNRVLKTMWRARSRQCYQVTVVDDQYLHVYDIQTHSKCR